MSRLELAQLLIVVLAGLAFVFAFSSSDSDLDFLTGGSVARAEAPLPPYASLPRETSTTRENAAS